MRQFTCLRENAMAGPLLAMLLPCECVLCAAPDGALLCPACRDEYFGPDAACAVARCPLCANPLPPRAADDGAGIADDRLAGSDGLPCARCLSSPPSYDATLAACAYEMPLDRLVLQLKFGARLAHGRLFGELLAAAAERERMALPALFCPVPLGAARLAERGFNQALEIARPLGRLLRVAVAPRLVQRVHDTAAQSRLAPGSRRANIRHAFVVPDRALVEGRHIGVVDDVMSSGGTLEELAATLKRYGAARVSNFVFARTPPHQY
jgi:ComF family protein